MTNLFYLMDDITSLSDICNQQATSNILYLVGVVVAVIRIAVPLILIVIGMVDLIKAMTSQDDKQIKSATTLLVKRVVIGVVVFLVPTIVGLLMNVVTAVSDDDYTACTRCVTNVWGNSCSWQD